MMEGIEILSQEVVKIMSFNMTAFWIPLIIFCGIGFFIAIDIDDFGAFLLCCIFGLLVGFMLGSLFEKETGNTYTKYKVTISDEVNFNEFQEKYEIINQEGKIYTIKEKEN